MKTHNTTYIRYVKFHWLAPHIHSNGMASLATVNRPFFVVVRNVIPNVISCPCCAKRIFVVIVNRAELFWMFGWKSENDIMSMPKINDFELLEIIGTGSYSTVHRARNKVGFGVIFRFFLATSQPQKPFMITGNQKMLRDKMRGESKSVSHCNW